MFAALFPAPGISALALPPRTRPAQVAAIRRLAGLLAWAGPGAYRPERHYMRGGRTEGSRNLERARRQIAGHA